MQCRSPSPSSFDPPRAIYICRFWLHRQPGKRLSDLRIPPLPSRNLRLSFHLRFAGVARHSNESDFRLLSRAKSTARAYVGERADKSIHLTRDADRRRLAEKLLRLFYRLKILPSVPPCVATVSRDSIKSEDERTAGRQRSFSIYPDAISERVSVGIFRFVRGSNNPLDLDPNSTVQFHIRHAYLISLIPSGIDGSANELISSRVG